jgi:hypothetical protein
MKRFFVFVAVSTVSTAILSSTTTVSGRRRRRQVEKASTQHPSVTYNDLN